MFTRLLSSVFCAGFACAATVPTFPALAYSTYLRDGFKPSAIATDAAGNVYLAGNAIVDPGTSQTSVLVVKLNPGATQYLYTRFLGGSISESAAAIAVDNAGNAYVAGTTSSPDFPVVGGSTIGTAPGLRSERSFVTKLDPAGQLVYSDLLGGSTNNYAQAVAVNAAGQVVVSGVSADPGFPVTQGAYSGANTAGGPWVLELDAAGAKVVFSATGIGGTALALDPAGNIYMAGTTNSVTYPTTAGTYQAAFPVFQTCIAPCHGSFQGANQYVSKLDRTGAKLIYSTAVSGTGNTVNQGLAVDAAGNVYLTGLAGAGYPFTVSAPVAPTGPAAAALATPSLPFLSKLDPNGQKLLFSVPAGGVGVQVGTNGAVYAGGMLGLSGNYQVAASLPALASLPAQCLLPDVTNRNAAWVAQVDGTSGDVLGSQFLGGSRLTLSGVALAGTRLWTAGATSLPDFPFSPNALTIAGLGPNPLPGAYLGAVDFQTAAPPAGTPRIGCVVDSADLEPAGPVAPYQLITIYGSGLGPAAPVIAADFSTTVLGGVGVSFGSLAASLLYVSENQINVVTPLVAAGPGAALQLTVNGVAAPALQFPVVFANPRLFVTAGSYQTALQDFTAVALNADGSVNSAASPAQWGSVISVFVNGLAQNPNVSLGALQLYTTGGWSVVNSTQTNPSVLRTDLRVPTPASRLVCPAGVCTVSFKVYDLTPYPGASLLLYSAPTYGTAGLAFGGTVYVAQQ